MYNKTLDQKKSGISIPNDEKVKYKFSCRIYVPALEDTYIPEWCTCMWKMQASTEFCSW